MITAGERHSLSDEGASQRKPVDYSAIDEDSEQHWSSLVSTGLHWSPLVFTGLHCLTSCWYKHKNLQSFFKTQIKSSFLSIFLKRSRYLCVLCDCGRDVNVFYVSSYIR